MIESGRGTLNVPLFLVRGVQPQVRIVALGQIQLHVMPKDCLGIGSRRAAIDVGSNSVLLLIAEWDGHGWRAIRELSRVTGLGTGTKTSGLLHPDRMADTLAALGEMFDMAREHGVSDVKAAGTMALRIATNTPEFLAMAAAQGTPVVVIAGDEEAELGFEAVASTVDPGRCHRLAIIDVGGHSTELVNAVHNGSAWVAEFRRSYPIGALGLRESIFLEERSTSLEILRASSEIDHVVGLSYRPGTIGEVVALGATGTNLVTIREKMVQWDADRVEGSRLDYEEISKAVGWMMPMSDGERADIIGIEKGREKTLHIGTLILERFLFALRAEGCLVSTRGWRHTYLARG